MMTWLGDMTWLDYALVIFIACSVLVGFFRGVVRESVSFVVWIAGLLAALKGAQMGQGLLSSWIASEVARFVIVFIVLFLCVIVLAFILNTLIHRFLISSSVGIVDRILGMGFGAVRGIFLVVLLLAVLHLGVSKWAPYKDSQLLVSFKPMVEWLSGALPKQVDRMSHWISPSSKETVQTQPAFGDIIIQ